MSVVGSFIYLLVLAVVIGSIYIIVKSAMKYTRDIEDKNHYEKYKEIREDNEDLED